MSGYLMAIQIDSLGRTIIIKTESMSTCTIPVQTVSFLKNSVITLDVAPSHPLEKEGKRFNSSPDSSSIR
jgi:hypothetical protein